jgi:hypothetical protein
MRLKKTIMLLGYFFLGFIILNVVGAASVYVLGKRLDRESHLYVDAALQAITANWDVRELQKRASPELDSSLDYDEAEQYFKELRKLGSLVVYKGAVGESTITVSARYLYEITADYTAEVEYETGSMQIQVTLIKHGRQWRILDFRVDPEEFSERNDVV